MESTMKTDVAIIGGGPCGSAAAIWLQRAGIETVLVERDPFPRFHIGESMTGECGQQVVALGLESAMREHAFPVKVGTAVYGPNGKNRFYVPVMARRSDGALTPGSTWQVRRSTFDQVIQEAAIRAGSRLIPGRATRPIVDEDGTVTGVRVSAAASGKQDTVAAKVVLDASGQGKFLAHAHVTSPIRPGRYFRQVALFTHFKGAIRDEGENPLDTTIFYRRTHHWSWFIPIDDEVTSIGVVVPSAYFRSFKETPRDFFLREVMTVNSELTRRLPDVEQVTEVRSVSNYSYSVDDFTGPGFLCAGDSHRFIDPIFSFGLFVALAEADLAARAIGQLLDTGTGHTDPLQEYRAASERGLDRFQAMIDGFWSNPLGFAILLHQRYLDDFIDLFAGRVYGDEDSPGLVALKKLNDRTLALGAPDGSATASPA